MRAKLLNDNGERVFAVIFETGDDPVPGLTKFAEEQKLSASAFTAIGAFSASRSCMPTCRRKHDPVTGLALIDIP